MPLGSKLNNDRVIIKKKGRTKSLKLIANKGENHRVPTVCTEENKTISALDGPLLGVNIG
jgi:hypothetical protein